MTKDRRGKRGGDRVTLKFESLPLRLPGEDDSPEPHRDSAELRLPSAEEIAAEDEHPSSHPPPGENARGRDGWERQRRSATPPPTSYDFAEVPPPARLPSEGGDALSLVDKRSRPPSSPMIDLSTEMSDRFALGDFTAALRFAELILGNDSKNENALATSIACKEKLVQLYGSRLGSLARVPHRKIDGAEVRWLGLDHRAGFLLSLVDGAHSLEELIDVSGMPRLEVLKTLVELLDMDAIRLAD